MHSRSRLEWTDLSIFREVYRAGSMLDAAAVLKCNPSTVSRRIAALEDQLGAPLFERGPGKWATTALAERIIPLADQMDDHAAGILRAAVDQAETLSGPITVTAGDAMMRSLLLPALADFQEKHPDISLTLLSDDERMDLGAREADVAVRCTPKPPPDLFGRNLGLAETRVYGKPALLAALDLADPKDIPCVIPLADGVARPRWVETLFPATERLIRVNSIGLMLDAARTGLGLALLPCMLTDTDPGLSRYPSDFSDPGWSIWVLSHADIRNSARVRVIRDALVEYLRSHKDLIAGTLKDPQGPIAAE
ncbi:MAG: LysR family transcriptional regulator [Pseudomonadota bacterium]